MSPDHQTKKYLTACLTALACATVSLPISAGAADAMSKSAQKETTINVNQNVIVVSGRMSVGALNGESGEYVVIPQIKHRLSQLDWKLDNVYMLGLGGSIAPLSWLKLNADIWFKLNDGTGSMDDYDWFIEDYTYTHWSHHEDVDLTKGLMFDINAELSFYQWEKSKFFAILGFKYDNWEWEARGGDYVYSTYYLYDTVGSFPDGELAITYEQKFYTPYLGIGFTADLDVTPITFSGRLIGSTLTFGESKDQHHMRNLEGEQDYDGGSMYAVDLGGAYNFTKNFSMMLSYHYQKYNYMRDNSRRLDLDTGVLTVYTDSDDTMTHYSNMVSLSAIVNF